ncbi:hypothetical protein AALO_G00189320 [Alosa alosa]|uniref:Uncharacterized protein n=1 Tax=Alosa alosa TaxID=278164 RepID=A0AAV6G8F8_9TELE|nr:hypothetical protein AALO_G00189320 [Alosa alosa]
MSHTGDCNRRSQQFRLQHCHVARQGNIMTGPSIHSQPIELLYSHTADQALSDQTGAHLMAWAAHRVAEGRSRWEANIGPSGSGVSVTTAEHVVTERAR